MSRSIPRADGTATPLKADARRLADEPASRFARVLLGSIATSKYVELLLARFGERVCFPEPFIGMGDMQRGALMLRAVEAGVELPYVRAAGAVRSRSLARARKGAPPT
jgi:hypothetical protein